MRWILSFLVFPVAAAYAGSDANYDESKVPAYTLPDVLTTGAGVKVASDKEWREVRRAEVLELFKTHVYGRSPGRPENMTFKVVTEKPDALNGKADGKEVDISIAKGDNSLRIRVNLFIPKQPRPAPAFLLICNRPPTNIDFSRANKSPFWPAEEIVARGYAAVAFHNADVDPDKHDGFKDGIHGLLDGDAPRAPDAWGTIAAWAWGASRVLDYLETEKSIDAARVAVVGHSRGGKTALWAGAQDERFALAISNESGEGGASLARRWYGETVARLNTSFPHWFCENYKKYNERVNEMPVDQHMLMALLAPRGVYVASAQDDKWADPKGEYLGIYHAAPVYALFGLKGFASETPPGIEQPVYGDRMGYHMRPGKHDLTVYDWQRFMDFADRLKK